MLGEQAAEGGEGGKDGLSAQLRLQRAKQRSKDGTAHSPERAGILE